MLYTAKYENVCDASIRLTTHFKWKRNFLVLLKAEPYALGRGCVQLQCNPNNIGHKYARKVGKGMCLLIRILQVLLKRRMLVSRT
jgi:hypothetical protein